MHLSAKEKDAIFKKFGGDAKTQAQLKDKSLCLRIEFHT